MITYAYKRNGAGDVFRKAPRRRAECFYRGHWQPCMDQTVWSYAVLKPIDAQTAEGLSS